MAKERVPILVGSTVSHKMVLLSKAVCVEVLQKERSKLVKLMHSKDIDLQKPFKLIFTSTPKLKIH